MVNPVGPVVVDLQAIDAAQQAGDNGEGVGGVPLTGAGDEAPAADQGDQANESVKHETEFDTFFATKIEEFNAEVKLKTKIILEYKNTIAKNDKQIIQLNKNVSLNEAEIATLKRNNQYLEKQISKLENEIKELNNTHLRNAQTTFLIERIENTACAYKSQSTEVQVLNKQDLTWSYLRSIDGEFTHNAQGKVVALYIEKCKSYNNLESLKGDLAAFRQNQDKLERVSEIYSKLTQKLTEKFETEMLKRKSPLLKRLESELKKLEKNKELSDKAIEKLEHDIFAYEEENRDLLQKHDGLQETFAKEGAENPSARLAALSGNRQSLNEDIRILDKQDPSERTKDDIELVLQKAAEINATFAKLDSEGLTPQKLFSLVGNVRTRKIIATNDATILKPARAYAKEYIPLAAEFKKLEKSLSKYTTNKVAAYVKEHPVKVGGLGVGGAAFLATVYTIGAPVTIGLTAAAAAAFGCYKCCFTRLEKANPAKEVDKINVAKYLNDQGLSTEDAKKGLESIFRDGVPCPWFFGNGNAKKVLAALRAAIREAYNNQKVYGNSDSNKRLEWQTTKPNTIIQNFAEHLGLNFNKDVPNKKIRRDICAYDTFVIIKE